MNSLTTAGIDVGACFAKMVIVRDGKVIGKGITEVTLEQEEAIEKVQNLAISDAHVDIKEIDRIGTTGSGRNLIKDAHLYLTDVTADAAGGNYVDKSIRTVIDVGGEEARALKVNEEGKIINFVVNDKCAAGAGAFCEAMARALELSLDDFAEYSLRSTERIPINAQCVIFAESEVVSLISDEVARENICRAILDGIAERITAMSKRVGMEQKVALIGGAVLNRGFVQSIKDFLGADVIVLPDPQFVSALGAAILAAKGIEVRGT